MSIRINITKATASTVPTLRKNSKSLLVSEITLRLKDLYPRAHIALEYSSPFELLIATMLSAQCTDERVNKVTAELFRKFRSPEDYLSVSQEVIEQAIYSTGFYKAKARNIQSCCARLIENFNSTVPKTMDELTSLAGVGRKTANVVLSHCFDIHVGIVVDTHVSRLVNLWGVIDSTNAEIIERELIELVEEPDWMLFTHLCISHGRAVCIARRPQCSACALSDICVSSKS